MANNVYLGRADPLSCERTLVAQNVFGWPVTGTDRAIATLTEAATTAASERALTNAGYPIDGADVGGGIHAPAVQSRTLRPVPIDIVAEDDYWRWIIPSVMLGDIANEDERLEVWV